MTDKQTEIRNTDYCASPLQIGNEISVTGKWRPRAPGGLFRKSPDADDLLKEWEDIHSDARADSGILQSEINHAVGEDAVLVHHVFKDGDALLNYFGGTASAHAQALLKVAQPGLHLVRGLNIPNAVDEALRSKTVTAAIGNYDYGFVRSYGAPDARTAIQVTAKWACNAGASADSLEELKHWWREVGNEAHEIEKGMQRFEVYNVAGEDALIIHETFETTDELKFHLTQGTAAKYKKHIDKIAAPENYYFRGPVAWMIRTYSKFMHLPATYSTRGSYHSVPGGSRSSGTVS
jgi:quinol monooxygenase YgiN